MKVIKRNGDIEEFNPDKVYIAIEQAMVAEKGANGVDSEFIQSITEDVANKVLKKKEDEIHVEDIQDIVEEKLMASRYKDVARAFINYRQLHKLIRESNTTDKEIKELINGESEYWNEENSNKNARVVTTQRDYIAGITSVDISRRFLLTEDIVKAHDEGIIHFHDMDYFAQKSLTNCELVNLEDMLQNGTVINGVGIDKPHRLITASTIATQIITAVTSSTYGGCTINIAHLSPFVRDSYNYHFKKYTDRGFSEEDSVKWAKEDLKKEVSDAVQTFNYQINSMTNTNGQAPFLSVFMYLNDNTEYIKETAMLIEEFLRQRIIGFKDETGHYITPAFPKLLYVLDENNITEDSEYWYLTELAAKCTAKRMVPDYISAKIMKRDKIDKNGNGNVYGCMGKRKLSPYKTNLTFCLKGVT